MFLNRESELKELDRLWAAKKANLIILYGRRRVGKSSLLKFFGKDKPIFYWTATKTTTKMLLQSFSRQLQLFKDPKASIPGDFSYPNWESALTDLAQYSRQNKIFIVFDEFPYAIETEGELPSLLQKIWDDNFSGSKANICITGSRIGMIEKQILSSSGPLYGRASAIMWLDPLPISVFNKFLPNYSKSQLVEVYSVTGGVPFYIEIFDRSISVLANIEREVRSKASVIKGEPYFLIHEELKEPVRYVAILEAIGDGLRTQSQISTAVGIEQTHLGPYLHTLEGLRFIKREIPVTEEPKKSRKGAYLISDMFMKFYFRFIAPNINLIEGGREDKLVSIIAGQFDAYVGKNGFEEICRKWLISEAKKAQLPFDPDIVGRYWDSSVEIDCAAISKKHKSIIIGEAKWGSKKLTLAVLNELNKKADYFSKKFGFHVNKMIFGRSGFDAGLTERAKIENVRLVTLDEMLT